MQDKNTSKQARKKEQPAQEHVHGKFWNSTELTNKRTEPLLLLTRATGGPGQMIT